MQAIKFRNFTDHSFTWAYDSTPYTFAPGQETYLEDFKAEHFAKHLVDEECNRLGVPTNGPERKGLEAKCFPADEVVPAAAALDLEVKKAVKKGKGKKEAEAEFADLTDK